MVKFKVLDCLPLNVQLLIWTFYCVNNVPPPVCYFVLYFRVAVNLTHGQLDTCVELTHLQKSQLDTSQLDTRSLTQLNTYVSLKAYTQQFNCSALGLCSHRKANISEDRLNCKAKVFCTCIFFWSCLPTRRCSLTCMSCHPSQEICSRYFSGSRPSRCATPQLASSVRTVYASIAKSHAGERTVRSTLSCQLRDAARASFNLLSFRPSRLCYFM